MNELEQNPLHELDELVDEINEREGLSESNDDKYPPNRVFYFVVPKIQSQFVWKSKLKKWLEENNIKDFNIIKGKLLEAKTKTVTKVDIII